MCKIFNVHKDFLINYKYERIKQFYGNICADVGAGNGWFSNYLNKNGHETVPLDIVDKSKFGTKIQLFDGAYIPLSDKSVDTTLFLFVLHHTSPQLRLLKEAIRISKKYIIIGEDIIESKIDALLGNIHLNTSPWAKGNSFRSEKGWLRLFRDMELKVVKVVRIPCSVYPVYPVTRCIFVLEVQS